MCDFTSVLLWIFATKGAWVFFANMYVFDLDMWERREGKRRKEKGERRKKKERRKGEWRGGEGEGKEGGVGEGSCLISDTNYRDLI